jgi:hypothetical protein
MARHKLPGCDQGKARFTESDINHLFLAAFYTDRSESSAREPQEQVKHTQSTRMLVIVIHRIQGSRAMSQGAYPESAMRSLLTLLLFRSSFSSPHDKKRKRTFSSSKRNAVVRFGLSLGLGVNRHAPCLIEAIVPNRRPHRCSSNSRLLPGQFVDHEPANGNSKDSKWNRQPKHQGGLARGTLSRWAIKALVFILIYYSGGR